MATFQATPPCEPWTTISPPASMMKVSDLCAKRKAAAPAPQSLICRNVYVSHDDGAYTRHHSIVDELDTTDTTDTA